ncbi:MAG: alpha-hydroxy-acid oxidizing protein [Aquamicrobium sp.]|uniref:alpha-hydroxy acid oxidase n=1 Tax=Aquamicrobium sp. TaxID=1872579 RepID=UPI00349EBF04|nr:alpha-hydroxy-acid oxidizing protein [Aquamicrobium sp.]
MSGPVPPDVVCAADYERHARERLPADIWAYIAGAGADGLTLTRNRAAFDRIELAGRVLADMRQASTATTFLGIDLPFPLLIAPVAHQRLVHPDGELASALGAASCGAAMCVSTLAGTTLEDIAARAAAPLIFQLYMQGGREAALSLVRRAEEAGYRALMVTVDAPVNGVRNDEQRAGFRLPAHVRPVNIEGMAGPVSRARPGESPVFKGLLDAAPRWDDIEWLRGRTSLPLILKGIVHPDDAERAIGLGADAVAVSNHGGRTLDTLPASIDALKAVAARVEGRVPLLLDGGIRRGTDILKALALGARACMIGQPVMHALAVAGPVGVVHLLVILRAELEVAMALTGRASIDAIDPATIWGSA